jgi:hypothetical protein
MGSSVDASRNMQQLGSPIAQPHSMHSGKLSKRSGELSCQCDSHCCHTTPHTKKSCHGMITCSQAGSNINSWFGHGQGCLLALLEPRSTYHEQATIVTFMRNSTAAAPAVDKNLESYCQAGAS